MSGRSAAVRKVKAKVDDEDVIPKGVANLHDGISSTASLMLFPNAGGNIQPIDDGQIRINQDYATVKTNHSSSSDELPPGYARVQRPHVPFLRSSQIEKSSFRELMDRRSEGLRKGLAKRFSKKKHGDQEEPRAETAAGISSLDSHEVEEPSIAEPKIESAKSPTVFDPPEFMRQGPPQTELPAIPLENRIKRWTHGGRPATQWNKLRKDPELWDPQGDTLVFLCSEHDKNTQPSFRIWSQVIESTASAFLTSLLTYGRIKEDISDEFDYAPDEFRTGPTYPSRRLLPTSFTSEQRQKRWGGSVSYEIYIPAESKKKEEAMKHQITTRNIFAMLCDKSIVGFSFYEALTDLLKRASTYWSSADDEPVDMVLRWLLRVGLDDCRNDPGRAAALLRWCEEPQVGYSATWREAFVHAAGQWSAVEKLANFMIIPPMTRHALGQASNELLLRVTRCEDRLKEFNPAIWENSYKSVAFEAYKLVQTFFVAYYKKVYGVWPPAKPENSTTWLTRTLVKELEVDMGALYDYLVDRDVVWEGENEDEEEDQLQNPSMVHKLGKKFTPDTSELPLTELITEFDDRHHYPHIPCPYPLVSEPDHHVYNGKNLKMSERVAALSYSDATNMYLMPASFVPSPLVEAFIQFENTDQLGVIDPHSARRGRWLCIYGILQTLATLSVDASQLRHADTVEYFLGCKLKRDPFHEEIPISKYAAHHTHSYCWTVRSTWIQKAQEEAMEERPRRVRNVKSSAFIPTSSSPNPSLHPFGSRAPSMHSTTTNSTDPGFQSSDANSQMRASTQTSLSGGSQHAYPRNLKMPEGLISATGYAVGIEKLGMGDWPIAEGQGQLYMEPSTEQRKSPIQQETPRPNSNTIPLPQRSPPAPTVEEDDDATLTPQQYQRSAPSATPSSETLPTSPMRQPIHTSPMRQPIPTRPAPRFSPEKAQPQPQPQPQPQSQTQDRKPNLSPLKTRPGNVRQRAQEFQEQRAGLVPKQVITPKQSDRPLPKQPISKSGPMMGMSVGIPMQEQKFVRGASAGQLEGLKKEYEIRDFDEESIDFNGILEELDEQADRLQLPMQGADGAYGGRQFGDGRLDLI